MVMILKQYKDKMNEQPKPTDTFNNAVIVTFCIMIFPALLAGIMLTRWICKLYGWDIDRECKLERT